MGGKEHAGSIDSSLLFTFANSRRKIISSSSLSFSKRRSNGVNGGIAGENTFGIEGVS